MSAVNYKIQMRSKQKNYHVNMLKPYHERKETRVDARPKDTRKGEEKISVVAASLVLKDGIGDGG